MNRVRTGLTGLALVFLIILIGTANFWPFGSSEPKQEQETLAKLGVAPSGDDADAAPPPSEPPAVLATPPLQKAPTPDEKLVIDQTEDLTEI